MLVFLGMLCLFLSGAGFLSLYQTKDWPSVQGEGVGSKVVEELRVTVYYDPGNPSNAILRREPGGAVLLLFLGSVMLATGWLGRARLGRLP